MRLGGEGLTGPGLGSGDKGSRHVGSGPFVVSTAARVAQFVTHGGGGVREATPAVRQRSRVRIVDVWLDG